MEKTQKKMRSLNQRGVSWFGGGVFYKYRHGTLPYLHRPHDSGPNQWALKPSAAARPWTLANLELRAAALGLKPLCLPRTREARKRQARGHSRNGPSTWRHTHIHVDKQKRNTLGTKHTSINTQHEWTTTTRNRNGFFLNLIYLIAASHVSLCISSTGLWLFLVFIYVISIVWIWFIYV